MRDSFCPKLIVRYYGNLIEIDSFVAIATRGRQFPLESNMFKYQYNLLMTMFALPTTKYY